MRACCLLVAACVTAVATAQKGTVTVERVEYRGWKNNLRLSNGSELRSLFPERLPVFYMYSLRRGTCVKPWFLPAQAIPCAASSCACRYSQND